MPTVRKQTPRKKRTAKKLKSVLDRIELISEVDKGLKMLIYGHSKTGKTTLACSLPKPLLLIGAAGFGTEKGSRSVCDIKDIHFVGLEDSEEIEQLVALDKYKSFVLDTAGGLQERIVNEFTGIEPKVRKDWRHVNKGDWGPINSRTMERLRWLLDAADLRGKYVCIIAHERAFNVDSEASLVFPHVGASLTPGVSGWLDGVVDYIGQCFIREETRVKKSGRVVIRKKTGKMQYCLRVGPDPIYRTGFRVPKGTELPDVIVDPTFNKINELIGG